MSEDDELSCVVASIYDAALNPVLWTDALANIAAFVGGRAGALGATDLVSKFVNAGHHVSPDLQYMQMHSETDGEFDPLATVPLVDLGQFAGLAARKPRDECCRGRVRPEWARLRGDVAGAAIEASEKSCRPLSVVRSKANGTIDDNMGRRMALVASHARRAVLIGKAIDRKANEAAIFADILDTLSAGLFLIDANGRIVHANAAGRGILDADDFMRSIGGRLAARDAQVNRTLREIFAAADSEDAEAGIKGIALPLTAEDGERYVAHVLPLASDVRRRAGVPSTVPAAVFVSKATLDTSSPPAVIGKAYN